mmetsp:Transcript_4349/g.4785  ORF Transcript_4349/g.4785 Transcript_4349/m.4785 type:complete len:492 (+) Transcript_4349:92-1567(+)
MTKGNKVAKRKLTDSSISSQCSVSSSSPPPPYKNKENVTNISSNDNDLFSAAEALTQLTRSSTPPLTVNNHLSTTTTPISSLSSSQDDRTNDGKRKVEYKASQGEHPLVTKVSKVSKHPIVTNAVKYYESSKRNYGAFNYAAGIVEKAAIPVVNKIEVNLNNRHQARQLKLEGESAQSMPVTVKKRRLGGAADYNKVVTMETKKRLQFCLHLLRLANDRINYKVNFLQQKVIDKERSIKEKRSLNNANKSSDIVNEDATESQEETNDTSENTPDTNITANNVSSQDAQSEAQKTKTEIVATVKKIIHVISTFKPSSLNTNTISPDGDNVDPQSRSEDLEFKSTIRDIILRLPHTIQQAAITNNTSAQHANDKIFVFARESLEMITKLTNVFNGQLEHAEQWLAGEMQKERERRKRLESKQETKKQQIEQNGTTLQGDSSLEGRKTVLTELSLAEKSKVDASQGQSFQEEINQGAEVSRTATTSEENLKVSC